MEGVSASSAIGWRRGLLSQCRGTRRRGRSVENSCGAHRDADTILSASYGRVRVRNREVQCAGFRACPAGGENTPSGYEGSDSRRPTHTTGQRQLQYVEHPGRLQRSEDGQIRVRSRDSVNFFRQGAGDAHNDGMSRRLSGGDNA